MVLASDILVKIPIRMQLVIYARRPYFCERFGIIERDVEHHSVLAYALKTLDEVQCVAMDVTRVIEPRFVI